MSVAETIRRKLTERFAPTHIEVEDQSHLHIGHEGSRPGGGGETHFAVTIVSVAFTGQTRVARQRLVYQNSRRRTRDPRPCAVADHSRSRRRYPLALPVPAASAMPEAATHAMAEITTAAVGKTYAMIEATHAMAEAMAECAVPAIVGSIGAIG